MKYAICGALALTSLLALGASAATPQDQPQDQDQGQMQPSGAAEAVMANDVNDFFETAASSNLFELQASQLAQKEATSTQLKDFADTMVKDHTKAARQLEELAKKKNVTLPTTLLKRHEMMLSDLKGEKRGKDFDDEYRDKMIESHKEAVSLFDQAAKESKDPDVKKFAARLLPTLRKHGGMAKMLPKAKG